MLIHLTHINTTFQYCHTLILENVDDDTILGKGVDASGKEHERELKFAVFTHLTPLIIIFVYCHLECFSKT